MVAKTKRMAVTTEVIVRGGWGSQTLILPGEPCVAPRPRLSKWGAYYPKKYKDWMAYVAAVLPQQPPRFGALALVYVELDFVTTKARTSKLIRPSGDIDNYAKAILDALTKKNFWKDDVDIVDLKATKRFADATGEPHTRIHIRRTKP